MSVLSPVLQKLDAGLPLERLQWDTARGEASLPEAAVLVALSDEPSPKVLLGRRALHLKHHPGEIAFPGGKREPEDATPWVTAQREAMEEVRLGVHLVHALGELQPLVTRTGFEVHPCVARIPVQVDLVVDRSEFESVFTQPLERFADPQLFRLETFIVDGQHLKVPHYQMEQDNIWGVTAVVLAMLANLAYDAGLDLQRDWKNTP